MWSWLHRSSKQNHFIGHRSVESAQALHGIKSCFKIFTSKVNVRARYVLLSFTYNQNHPFARVAYLNILKGLWSLMLPGPLPLLPLWLRNLRACKENIRKRYSGHFNVTDIINVETQAHLWKIWNRTMPCPSWILSYGPYEYQLSSDVCTAQKHDSDGMLK